MILTANIRVGRRFRDNASRDRSTTGVEIRKNVRSNASLGCTFDKHQQVAEKREERKKCLPACSLT